MPKGNPIPRQASQKLRKFAIKVLGGSSTMEHPFPFSMMIGLGTDHSENSYMIPFMLMKLLSKSRTHGTPKETGT